MIMRIVAFMLSMIFGITMLSPSYQDGVSVYIELVTPVEELQYGQPVELECIVDGLDDPDVIRWQYLDEYGLWHDAGCGDFEYCFILDEENAQRYYRVVVID